MQAQHDCQKPFLNIFHMLRVQFVRFVVPGIALLTVVLIFGMMFLTMHASTTHITHSSTQLIAGQGPGDGPSSFPTSTPTP